MRLIITLYALVFYHLLRLQITPARNSDNTFGIEEARRIEAQRRLRLLGDTVGDECSKNRLRRRARRVFVDPYEFERWWRAYRAGGVDALLPDWQELGIHSRTIAVGRYQMLGVYADREFIDSDDIRLVAEANRWSFSSAWRWLRRYRTLGLWGLAPKNNPFKQNRKTKVDKRRSALGAISDEDLRETYQRFEAIQPLTLCAKTTNGDAEKRAKELGLSSRTLRIWLAAYREGGLKNLIPQERSDKGTPHGISPRMEKIIRGIRLSTINASVNTVYQEAIKRAEALGEKPPSRSQVRFIIDNIPEPLLLLADRRDREFRNKYRITYRMSFEGIVWQIDQTPIDTLAVDIRLPKYQTKSGEKRIYLTGVIECKSRRVLAVRIGYDQANQFNVAAVLREAIIVGGIPDEILTDRGGEFTADHIQQLLKEFGITLTITSHAELKGRIERIFGTFNQQLWSQVQGYVGSNTAQRNPNNRPVWTIAELERWFWKYIDEQYHCQPHSSLPFKEPLHEDDERVRMNPLEYWNEFCFAIPIDPRRLDIFLTTAIRRKVGKWGIKHDHRKYWHEQLGGLVGEWVTIRSAPYYEGPDEVEVFHEGNWICTAFAQDSARGEAVTGYDVRRAQQNQRAGYREAINIDKEALREADQAIKAKGRKTGSSASSEDSAKRKDVEDNKSKGRVSPKQKNAGKRWSSPLSKFTDEDMENLE